MTHVLEPTTERLLTVREAAHRVGVTVHRIAQMARRGEIRAVRVGHIWLIPESQVQRIAQPRPTGRPRSGSAR